MSTKKQSLPETFPTDEEIQNNIKEIIAYIKLQQKLKKDFKELMDETPEEDSQ